MDDFSQMMTPLDQRVCNPTLQMAKLLIPFLPPQSQRMMAVYIKFQEFQNTLSFFHAFKQKGSSPDNILDSLKPYLPNDAKESMDNIMNMMQMMNMFQEMQGDMNFDPMDMMAGMFTAQQHDVKEGESND